MEEIRVYCECYDRRGNEWCWQISVESSENGTFHIFILMLMSFSPNELILGSSWQEKINVMENSLVSIVQSLASTAKHENRGPPNSWKSKSEPPNLTNLKSPSPFWSQDDETASQISFNTDKPTKEEQNTLLHITAALGYAK